MKHLYSGINNNGKKSSASKQYSKPTGSDEVEKTFSPRASVVDEILAYSKALEIRSSQCIDEIALIMN